MNLLVSYDWLKEYVKLRETPEEFAKRISLSGPAVEKITPAMNAPLDKVVVGRIQAIKPHPNADKLKIAVVDVGRGVINHAQGRDKSRPYEIVCGGTNLKIGQWVAVALVGAKVRWHGEGNLTELRLAEIRGVKSEGMICAASEIGLFDAFPHAEKEILDLGEALGFKNMTSGTPLSDALGLSKDVIMDVEVTSNRIDAMGMVGLAREAAAILNRPFMWKPATFSVGARFPRPGRGNLAPTVPVKISAKKLCPRYMAVRIDGVKVGSSPWWLKRRLMLAGLTSINNIVDITNYVLLELAQPLHAFDGEKIDKGIEVRTARRGEKIKALDQKTYELDDSVLVIADKSKPIAIAGMTGGEETGVTDGTTSIILEAAAFDPVSIRRTARKLNLQSDSQLRFEKGLSTEALPYALARAIELVLELAGGRAGPVADVRTEKYKALTFIVTTDEVRDLMGVQMPPREIAGILKRLGFKVVITGKRLKATVPWWRDHDIEMGRDLVEEIARVYGYGRIPPVIPMDVAPRPMDAVLIWEDRIREMSKGAGMIEAYSYSFVSRELLERAGYDPSGMLRVQNPLTSELEIMRTTLLPSLLQVAAENRERESEIRLFEISNVYYPRHFPPPAGPRPRLKSNRDGGAELGARNFMDLPDEQLELGALFMGMEHAWKAAKGFVEHVLKESGIENVTWRRLSDDPFWHPGRTAQAFAGDHLLATVGELSPKIAERFKLERPALVDIPLETIVPLAKIGKRFVPISLFPTAKRDLAVVVDQGTEYAEIARLIRETARLVSSVEWFDTYKGKNLPENKKSVALHLSFSSPERTLESKEVDGLMEKIQAALKNRFDAEIRN